MHTAIRLEYRLPGGKPTARTIKQRAVGANKQSCHLRAALQAVQPMWFCHRGAIYVVQYTWCNSSVVFRAILSGAIQCRQRAARR
eukprot:5358869-Pyramimonas_sp.AAC.1